MDGTGPVEGEEEVRWKELRRQAWEGLGWKSRSGWEGRRGLEPELEPACVRSLLPMRARGTVYYYLVLI